LFSFLFLAGLDIVLDCFAADGLWVMLIAFTAEKAGKRRYVCIPKGAGSTHLVLTPDPFPFEALNWSQNLLS
jgi:hypothetical protein